MPLVCGNSTDLSYGSSCRGAAGLEKTCAEQAALVKNSSASNCKFCIKSQSTKLLPTWELLPVAAQQKPRHSTRPGPHTPPNHIVVLLLQLLPSTNEHQAGRSCCRRMPEPPGGTPQHAQHEHEHQQGLVVMVCTCHCPCPRAPEIWPQLGCDELDVEVLGGLVVSCVC